MKRELIARALGLAVVAWSEVASQAGVESLANGSFESPATTFVNTHVDAWQKTPKPADYDESGGFFWDQLAGVFKNTPAGSADHIDNVDGAQALYVFAVPGIGLFQDFDSSDWASEGALHRFDARYETGKSYQLSVRLIGGGGNMAEGVPLELGFYYRDDLGGRVTVARNIVRHSGETFTNLTHFIEFTVLVPTVRPEDAWANRHMGVQILSTVAQELAGGYWDVDRVRVEEVQPLRLSGPAVREGRFEWTVEGRPGGVVELQAAAALGAEGSGWSSLGTITNLTGRASFDDPAPLGARRFYRARELR